MIDRTKKLPARFYVSRTGRKPVRDWILELTEADRYVIGKDIQKVEFGWPLGRPHCAPLGEGLWEVRSTFGQSNRASDILHERRIYDLASRLHQEDAKNAPGGPRARD